MIKYLKRLRYRPMLARYKNISFGKNSTFGRETVFYASNQLMIGASVYIDKYCIFNEDIEVGTDILFGNIVGVIGHYDHDFSYVGKSIKDSPWIWVLIITSRQESESFL